MDNIILEGADTNYWTSHSQTLSIMLSDDYGGTWSIKGEYKGLRIGNTWVHILHSVDETLDLLYERATHEVNHQGTHIQVGRVRYEIGDN